MEIKAYEVDREKIVVGSIILDPSRFHIVKELTADDFGSDAHRAVFQALSYLVEHEIPVDLININAAIEAQNNLEKVGENFCADLVADIATTAGLEHHVTKLLEARKRRELIKLMHKAGDDIRAGVDAQEIYDKLRTDLDNHRRQTDSNIELVTLHEISKAEIKDQPLIEGLLGEKESLIIVGPSGVGKSLVADYISIVAGMPEKKKLWGLFEIDRPLKTLLVQSENSMTAQKKRLNMMFNGAPELQTGSDNVVTTKIGGDCRMAGVLTDGNFQSLLMDLISKAEADILVLDPLISYHDRDENDNVAMRRALDCLTMICDRANVSTILCHHFNRQNQTRGAAAIRDWVSNMVLFEPEKRLTHGMVIKVSHDKSRNYELVPDFYLERTADLNFLRVGKPESKESRNIDAVVSCLFDLGGATESQKILKSAVMEKLNCSEASARRAIDQALEVKKIVVNPGTGKGNPYGYKIGSAFCVN